MEHGDSDYTGVPRRGPDRLGRRQPSRYEPEIRCDDDYPSEVSSDCEVIEIDISDSSEVAEHACDCNNIYCRHMLLQEEEVEKEDLTENRTPTKKARTLNDSFRSPRTVPVASISQATTNDDAGETSTGSSSPLDVEARGPKRSVEFLCTHCGVLNRFSAIHCLYCKTLQRFNVCSHCVMTHHK